jgi:hypothetical protein
MLCSPAIFSTYLTACNGLRGKDDEYRLVLNRRYGPCRRCPADLAGCLPGCRYCAGGAPTWSSAAASDLGMQEELLAALQQLLAADAGGGSY